MAPHLNNAPIIEAIFEVLVKLPTGFSYSNLEPLYELIKDDFPNKTVRHPFRQTIKISQDGVESGKEDLGNDGFIARSKDGKSIVQFRLDGMSYSRLAPYTSWENVFEETMKYWKIFSSKTSPKTVSRFGVRFINLLEIPVGTPIEDVFKTPPPMPVDNQVVIQFTNQVVFQNPVNGFKATIVQATQPPEDEKARILLDIDVAKEVETECKNEIIESTFNSIRPFKNQLFFGTVSEKLIGRYQ